MIFSYVVRNLQSNTKQSIYESSDNRKKYERTFTRWLSENVLSQLFLCQLVSDTVIRQLSFVRYACVKALANEDTLLPTQMFPLLHASARNICCGHKKCFRFCSETFCVRKKCFPQFAQPNNHHGQQCVRDNVSSFTRALII